MARTAMLFFGYYPSDNRVRREAEALEELGYKLDIICIQDNMNCQRNRLEIYIYIEFG